MSMLNDVISFIHNLSYDDIPTDVVHAAKRSLLDTIACAAAGSDTTTNRAITQFATQNFGLAQSMKSIIDTTFRSNEVAESGCSAPKNLQICKTTEHSTAYGVLFNPSLRFASLPGALLINATQIDSFDAHDGDCYTKGHSSVAIVPAALAMAQWSRHLCAAGFGTPMGGKELLTLIVVGVEVAIRAGMALHESSTDYHSSGAWNAMGVAAVIARSKGFSTHVTIEALRLAETLGPRSQMNRNIRHPSMLKDGSGWGAMIGASAALMAECGCAGSCLDCDLNFEIRTDFFETTFANVSNQTQTGFESKTSLVQCRCYMAYSQNITSYILYPIIYWAHAAIASLTEILKIHPNIPADQIQKLRVHTFSACRQLNISSPTNAENAQYSLPFALVCIIIRGRIGVDEIADGWRDPKILKISKRVEILIDEEYDKAYNDTGAGRHNRYSHVVIELDGNSRNKISRCTNDNLVYNSINHNTMDKTNEDSEFNSTAIYCFNVAPEVIVGPVMEPPGKHDSTTGPLTDEQLTEKAKIYLGTKLSVDKTNEVIENVWNMDSDVGDLLKLLF